MTIPTPEPGELVKTVSELVNAVNEQSGASVDWNAVTADQISLESTVEALQLQATGTEKNINLYATGAINVSAIQSINISTNDSVYFNLGAPPEVPASPSIQDVVDALVGMGLIAQAAL